MKKALIHTVNSRLMSSNMYLLTEEKHVLIIDPCISVEALQYLQDHNLSVDRVILTHEHYDHISGVNWLREWFPCQVICSASCAREIQHPNRNYSKYFETLMEVLPAGSQAVPPGKIEPYSCCGDLIFEQQMSMEWQGHYLQMIETPGHSRGSICISVDDRYLFSGDSLLRDYPAITRLRGGSSKLYKERTFAYFQSFAQEIIVYPGHYESFKLEERLKQLVLS